MEEEETGLYVGGSQTDRFHNKRLPRLLLMCCVASVFSLGEQDGPRWEAVVGRRSSVVGLFRASSVSYVHMSYYLYYTGIHTNQREGPVQIHSCAP